jgi:subfamily B ATP-binding cassette protein MsbA
MRGFALQRTTRFPPDEMPTVGKPPTLNKVLKAFRSAGKLGLRGRDAIGLLALDIVGSAFEGVGAAMLLPLMELIGVGGDVAAMPKDVPFWNTLGQVFATLGLPLTFATLMLAVTVSLLGRSAIVCLHKIYRSWVRHGLLRKLRNFIFQGCLGLSVERNERMNIGELINGVLVEAERAVRTMILALTLVAGATLIVMYLGLMLTVSASMTFAFILIFGAESYLMRGILRRTREEGSILTAANQSYASHLVERLRLLRHIRLSDMRDPEFEEGRRRAQKQADSAVQLIRLSSLGVGVVESLIVVTAFALMYVGHAWFELTLPELLISLGMIFRLAMLTKSWVGKFQKFLGQQSGFEVTENLLDELGASEEGSGGSVEFGGVDRGIRFEGVRFAYASRSDVAALSDVTLEIGAGALTAIVGPSGAGKSTLIDLLPRLRHPTQGRVTIDGVGLEEYELNSLRRGIAYVPQEPQVFNVAIKDHIGYGNPLGDISAVREAADLAGASTFIENLPKGYETMLGEGGIELSGGQRQRLDLARALMRQAPILILDEPASRLDAEAEQGVREALKRIRARGVTVIVVAHRFTTVADADRIVVLEGGRISATGSHDELIGGGGWYARAYRQQSHPGEHAATPESVDA